MKTLMIVVASTLLFSVPLSACQNGAPPEGDKAASAPEAPMPSSSAAQQALTTPDRGTPPYIKSTARFPNIEVFYAPDIPFDCAYYKSGHTYDPMDFDSYKFVLLNFMGDPNGTAQVNLNGMTQNLERVSQAQDGAKSRTLYKTTQPPFIGVLLETETVETKEFETRLTGQIAIVKSMNGDTPEVFDQSVMPINGSCGT